MAANNGNLLDAHRRQLTGDELRNLKEGQRVYILVRRFYLPNYGGLGTIIEKWESPLKNYFPAYRIEFDDKEFLDVSAENIENNSFRLLSGHALLYHPAKVALITLPEGCPPPIKALKALGGRVTVIDEATQEWGLYY